MKNNIHNDLKNKLKPFGDALKITNPDTTMKIIQEFKSPFEKGKAFFAEQFTPETLRRLTLTTQKLI